MKSELKWDFPLPRPHTGVVLGNGVQGLMVWGAKKLTITIARAGFWDRRGGTPFDTRATFAEVRRLLEAGDEAGIRRIFSLAKVAGKAMEPYQLGGARLELSFDRLLSPVRATLNLRHAVLDVEMAGPGGAKGTVRVRQAMGEELAWLEWNTHACGEARVRVRPAYEFVREELAGLGVTEPEPWTDPDGGGFTQRMPEDDPLGLAWRLAPGRLTLATALGPDAGARARKTAREADPDAAVRRTDRWWNAYWRDVPKVDLPDPDLQHAWEYGVYKQAGLTTPGGVAATLQGPWMEDYQVPPWSNDYHFNINVQMVYGPCLGTNRAAHLAPLWALLREWMPRLTACGERFFGVPGAMMLPHAVDDRCHVVGSFWTGTIDQACTGWMAHLAWKHYRYTLDETVLRETAWPLLNGAFNGYWGMLEEVAENGGKRWSLPVSVSPEYRGAAMNAWGRDASFQLACLHAVAEALNQAADILGEPRDPRWQDVADRLPPYTTVGGRLGERRIALWDGTDLEESHRHHSHLAGLYPFATWDPLDPQHRPVAAASLAHWERMGAGMWTGWCVPWAAILCARCGLADAAVNWLRWWKQLFTNEGHGTLHNADFPGCGRINDGALGTPDFRKSAGFREVMQMDAAMGAVTAILELLVQARRDGLYVLPRLPKWWRALAFDGVRTEGAFLVGATVCAGRVAEIRVRSLAGAPLELAHGFEGEWTVNGTRHTESKLVCATKPGDSFKLAPVS